MMERVKRDGQGRVTAGTSPRHTGLQKIHCLTGHDRQVTVDAIEISRQVQTKINNS